MKNIQRSAMKRRLERNVVDPRWGRQEMQNGDKTSRQVIGEAFLGRMVDQQRKSKDVNRELPC